MPEIEDLFGKLKQTIMGTQTQKIDAKLDKMVKDISTYRQNSGKSGYLDLVKNLISKTASIQIGSTGGLFSQGVGPAAFGQGGRLLRYKTYEAIVSTINYAYRALNVLVDNILSPDDITKVSLEVKAIEHMDEETGGESEVRRVKEVIKRMNLEEKLEMIVRNTLMYGDFFCEIADSVTALTSKSLISESLYHKLEENYFSRGDKIKINERIDGKDFEITLNFSAFSEVDYINELVRESEKESEKEKEKEKNERGMPKSMRKKLKSLKNLQLVFHEPQYVVKLQSALFPVCFGYLVFPKITVVPGASIADDAINNIVMSILKNLERKVPQMKEFKDTNELKYILRQMLAQSDLNRAVEIRYVPPNKITHFRVPTSKYYPYGESIFDSGQYTSKVLIALETALAIQRLSRSTEKRKIAIEVGLPRDAKKIIESLKEEFRKRKVSLDSFGSVDTIPSMITTFEDVYIPQKDGKPFVDISTFNEGNVDIRSKTDELKFLRDQMVAGLGVPPSFLGIEENLSNKAALSEENILFARTIIGHQKYITHQIQDLMEMIFEILDPGEIDPLEGISISLPPPKSLQYEREARYVNEVTGLIEGLERVGIPKDYSKRKYLTNIDWDEVDKFETDENIKKVLDPSKQQDEMGGDFGGGGFGGGGFGGGGEAGF